MPIRHSQSYSADYTDGLSSSKNISRIRTIQSSPNCTLAEEEKRTKKRRRRRQPDETSGYSTTSLSEMSEFETSPRRADRRRGSNDHHLYVGKQRRESLQDDQSEKSRISRVSQSTNRRESEEPKPSPNRRISEVSKSSSRHDMERMGHRIPRARSTADSIGSLQSARSAKSNHTHKSNHSKSQANSNSTLQRKITTCSATDQIDPFAFIQPVPESFSTRLRKTMGPCMGTLLLLILAASLGAAIYFAIELKKTHEDEIEMLRANLALKIKNTRYAKNLDKLTQADFDGIALDYCQQMDQFYQRSHFKSTYRGCEVLSIRTGEINFTLFFMEKEASKKDIISVIETAAPKVDDSGQSVALVDKFEIELENAKVTIEHKRTPVSFNKLSNKPKTKTTPEPVTKTMTIPLTTTTDVNVTRKLEELTSIFASSTTTTEPITTTRAAPTTTTPQPPSASDLAWNPCAYKDGAFYPHPIACNKYFQCEHGRSRLQTCTGDLLFDVTSAVCVADRPSLVCPDIALAPPAPPTTPSPVTKPRTSIITTTTTQKPRQLTTVIRNKSVTSSIYPSRPVYDKNPCKTGLPGQLFPHPDDCLKFIQCISPSKGVVQKCATDLVYDPESMACVFPRNPELVCPDLIPCNGVPRGYFPHPYNCTKYIQCESGREVIQSCNTGLVWDPTINSCVYRTPISICPDSHRTGTN